MKLGKFLMIGFVVAGTMMAVSCKKEVKIEKNLWKNGGEWDVKSYVITNVSSDPTENYTDSYSNLGTFTFEKEGKGSFSLTMDGEVQTGTFTYENTDYDITMEVFGETQIFDLEWEKNNMTWSEVEVTTVDGETTTYSEVFELVKK